MEELEKASESANHENRLLRAKVDKMTVELTEYKKRISILANRRTTTAAPASSAPFGRPMLNNINDIDFRFDFPKFGVLSGPGTQAQQLASGATTVSPPKRSESGRLSPRKDSKDTLSPSDATHAKEDLANFTSLFSPALANNGNLTNTSRTSFDSHYSAAGVTTTSSPSASSNSHAGGNNSSCGTSPEPLTQSPTGFKPVDTMTTIGEEQPAVQSFSQGKEKAMPISLPRRRSCQILSLFPLSFSFCSPPTPPDTLRLL